MEASTILVVERDILVRHPLAQYLRDCGYDVVEVPGVDEARLALSNRLLRIDVALIDLQAATEAGFGLASWVRTHCPDVEVILAGTVAKAMQTAGDLCDEGPAPSKHPNHRAVLDHIRRLLATRHASTRGESDK